GAAAVHHGRAPRRPPPRRRHLRHTPHAHQPPLRGRGRHGRRRVQVRRRGRAAPRARHGRGRADGPGRRRAALRAGPHGHRDPRGVWRRRHELHGRHHRHRGARARGPLGQRPGRRAQHALQHRHPQVRLAGPQAGLAAAAGHKHRRVLLPLRARLRLRRLRHGHQGHRDGRRVPHLGRQDVDHKLPRGRPLHRLRQPRPQQGLPRHHRLPRREGHPGLLHRQEGEEAGHPRQQHLRPQLRRRRDPQGEPARRARPRLQVRHQPAQRGPHRHRRPDDGARPRRLRQRRQVRLERPPPVRLPRRRVPGHAAPDRPELHRDRRRPRPRLQRRPQEGGRRGLCPRRRHGQALRLPGRRPRQRPGRRVDGRHGLCARGPGREVLARQQDWCHLRGHQQYSAQHHCQAAAKGVHQLTHGRGTGRDGNSVYIPV
ncbi:hypothetical protein TPAR_00669, partial [Tolypocladium paradoxum]